MISDYPVFYITPDPLRAVGLAGIFDDFRVVCYDDKPLVDQLNASGVKTLSLMREEGAQSGFLRNAGKMLENLKVREFIENESKGKRPAILFFKPSFKIDLLCEKYNYIKIGNDADLNRKFEDKIEFFKMCTEMGWPTPPGLLGKLSDFKYSELLEKLGTSFVVQFGRGWAGSTTFFIDSQKDWKILLHKWPEKEIKVSRRIDGFTVLNNACVVKGGVLVSDPAVQLPVISGMTGKAASTFGRQWPSGLNEAQIGTIRKLTQSVGMKMGETGYRGWFGLDFLVDEADGEIYISENNARLTASATFFTQAELESGQKKPMLYFHALQFLNKNTDVIWQPLKSAVSQFVYRNFETAAFKVTRSVRSGVYDLSLSFRRDGSGISDLKGTDEIFLYAPENGEIINPDIEFFTIEYKGRLLNNDRSYEKWFLELVTKINRSIKFVRTKNA